MRRLRRFIKDQNRGISMKMFAELCGLDRSHILDVFLYRTAPLTEYVQVRASKGYEAWRKGEVAIMKNRDNTKFVAYRREEKPRLASKHGLASG